MRESIGGALLIKLVMVFIVIYIAFLGIAINYAITFRVKNQIVNLIEEYEGLENATPRIEDYIANVGYFRTNSQTVNCVRSVTDCPALLSKECINGYCIETCDTVRGKYYKVTTCVSFSFPIIGNFTTFPVTGETRVIYQGL